MDSTASGWRGRRGTEHIFRGNFDRPAGLEAIEAETNNLTDLHPSRRRAQPTRGEENPSISPQELADHCGRGKLIDAAE